MASQTCCSQGYDYFDKWVVPEGMIHSKLGKFYEAYPLLSRVIAAPSGVLLGVVKLALFPVMCVVGVVAIPIIAIVRGCQGSSDSGSWLGAWAFCLLGVAGCGAFVALAGFSFPMVVSMSVLVSAVALSIIVHVHKLVKEPVA